MLVIDLLTRARRRIGTLDKGEPYEADEYAADLDTLNMVLRSMQGSSIGSILVAKPLSASGAALSGFAYQVNTSGGAIALTTPASPREGQSWGVADTALRFDTDHLTITGAGALIEGDGSLILSTVGDNRIWFFRADTGNWERFRDLALTDAVWLPDALHDALIWLVAARLAPDYGVPLTDATGKPGMLASRGAEAEAMISARFGRKG